MKTLILFITILFTYYNIQAQIFDTDTLLYNGHINDRINLVILGDGYQAHELNKFVSDAQHFSDDLFMQQPFISYKKYFNVFIIKVPSTQSGASHPGTANDVSEPIHPVSTVNNYFGSTFDFGGIHRLLVATGAIAISNVLAQNFPLYDQAFILTNSPYYGGSGGTNPVASTESSSSEIAIHELGHSFVHLADEYWAGDAYAGEAINMSQQTDPALIKWKNWYNIQGIGIYQHCCGGVSASWYRPHQNCKMRALGNPFCAVCREAIIEKIHTLTNPIEQFSPDNSSVIATSDLIEFKLNLLAPTPNTLKVKWILNGDVIMMPNNSNFTLDVNNLVSGTNTLNAIVEDTTQLLRVNNHSTFHFYTVSWTIQKMLTAIENIEASKDKIEISSYPNPTTDLLNIQIKNEKAASITIELYNNHGLLIKSTPYNKILSSVNQFQLDLKNQPSGIYFVKILVNNMPFSLKIFKAG